MILLNNPIISTLIAIVAMGVFLTLAKILYAVFHKLFSNDKDKEIIPKLKDEEIFIKEKNTGNTFWLKRSEWEKIVNNGEQDLYEVLY
jgi:hypothetical protein